MLESQSEKLSWIVAFIWIFDNSVDLARLKDLFRKMVEEFPRLKSRPTGKHLLRNHKWELIDGFDVDDIIETHKFPISATMNQFQAYASRVIGEPLDDHSRPLWRLYVINGIDGVQKSAIIIKAHHCITDGEGFIRAVLTASLGRENLNETFKMARERMAPPKLEPSELPILRLAVFKPHVDKIPKGLLNLYYLLLQILFAINWAFVGLWESIRLNTIILGFRRKNFLYNLNTNIESSSPTKTINWSEEINIEDIRIPRKAYKVSLNDVMVATITRAIRSYLVEQNRLLDPSILLFIPLSMRRKDDFRFTNLVSGVYAFFPFADLSTKNLLKAVHEEMNKVKRSLVPPLAHLFADKVYIPGTLIPRPYLNWMCGLGHGVVSNVPGPPNTITIAGQVVKRFLAVPPQNTPGGLAMAILSYNGKITLSIFADNLVEYPLLTKRISELFVKEFNKILEDAKFEIARSDNGNEEMEKYGKNTLKENLGKIFGPVHIAGIIFLLLGIFWAFFL
ncbi:hypothetical protein G9A89_005716 [Geosiphon pyriformis]|nr:hypothetical protein G9A89_005716 [Geosiphon pyriformis]